MINIPSQVQSEIPFTGVSQSRTSFQSTKDGLKKIQEDLNAQSIDDPGVKGYFHRKLLSFWPDIKAASAEFHTLSPDAKKAFTHQVSEALFTLGECYYAVDYDTSRKFYILAAMMETGSEEEQAQIMALDFKFDPSEVITNLKKIQNLDAFVDESLVDVFMQRVNPENGLHVGRIYRKLGHCYQNMSSFNSKNEGNIKRLETVYDISRKAITNSHDPDANWEMIELIYNTEPFMLGLTTNLTLLQRILSMYDNLKPLFAEEGKTARALSKEAQVLNLENVALAEELERCNSPEAAKKIADARWENQQLIYKIAQEPDMNSFLKHMLYHVTASEALSEASPERRPSLSEIRKMLEAVEQYIEECNYEHTYFPRYLETIGELCLKEGNRAKAVDYFAKSIVCYQKYPDEIRALSALGQMLINRNLLEEVKARYDWAKKHCFSH